LRKAIIFISVVLVLSGCMVNKTVSENVDKKESTIEIDEVVKTPKFVVYDEPPNPIKREPPIYSESARNQGIQGEVWLEVEILADGSVGIIEIRKSLMPGPGGLDISAVNSVKQWKFSPAKRKGKPVACWLTFPITFELK
jgi:protein TonB